MSTGLHSPLFQGWYFCGFWLKYFIGQVHILCFPKQSINGLNLFIKSCQKCACIFFGHCWFIFFYLCMAKSTAESSYRENKYQVRQEKFSRLAFSKELISLSSSNMLLLKLSNAENLKEFYSEHWCAHQWDSTINIYHVSVHLSFLMHFKVISLLPAPQQSFSSYF